MPCVCQTFQSGSHILGIAYSKTPLRCRIIDNHAKDGITIRGIVTNVISVQRSSSSTKSYIVTLKNENAIYLFQMTQQSGLNQKED